MTSRPRRAMNESAALIARRTQAARDALRRRQKEKKARIVKRHVRYKQKQKLLSQLQASEREEPIVAPEFASLHHEEEEEQQQEHSDMKDNAPIEPSASEEDTEQQPQISSEEVQQAESEEIAPADDSIPKRSKKKYIPFAKERKQFEEMKEKREQEQKEREQRIKQRESMLKSSKKRRKKQAKQYRAVTHRGQPKMKHRMDALLSRIEKQK